MKIIKHYKKYFILSAALILIGLGVIAFGGLNYGIDFTGGTMLTIPTGESLAVDDISNVLADFDLDPVIQHQGADDATIIIKTKKPLDTEQRNAIRDKLIEDFDLSADTKMDGEQFGPSIGEEISKKALISMGLAAAGMLVYITVRFKFFYGVAAIIALIHDLLILIGLYAVFNITVNSNFIAAVLTILGYSINDTIVIFDRIRENSKSMRNKPKLEIAGHSLDQSLSRTFLTSITTFVVVFFLYIFGVPTVKEFALPLMFGIVVGTYSSVFLAGPIWALLSKDK
ncbi:MAG TPA: protein translocase subunit SecF [Clostridia bacterium]|nr:protein translocase subunit SecF [Clostridia bacterium]